MRRDKNKIQALELATEINVYGLRSSTGHALFDLMRRASDDDEVHCGTCNCQSYMTHTGYSLYSPNDEESIKAMSTKQRLAFARQNPDKVLKSSDIKTVD